MDQRQAENPNRITGTIERVTFHNAESGFCVLRIAVSGHRELVTVVGTLPEPRPGEWLDAQGDWIVDKVHGRQFKAETMRTATPNTREGIEQYLASGLIKGIGPKLAQRLVERYGEQVLEVIDAAPNSLTKVEGIGPERIKRIRDAWAEQKTVREIMVFLHSHGVSTSRAFRIYKHLRRRGHREGHGRPVPPGPRHPGHRLQDGRPDRRADRHRRPIRSSAPRRASSTPCAS